VLVEASPPPGYKHTRRQVVATLWARVQRTGHAATVPLGACERVLEGTLPHLYLSLRHRKQISCLSPIAREKDANVCTQSAIAPSAVSTSQLPGRRRAEL